MSSHQIPVGLTQGYSNSFRDMLVRINCPVENEQTLTNDDLDRMDEEQVV